VDRGLRVRRDLVEWTRSWWIVPPVRRVGLRRDHRSLSPAGLAAPWDRCLLPLNVDVVDTAGWTEHGAGNVYAVRLVPGAGNAVVL
jgi:hypothetical protein